MKTSFGNLSVALALFLISGCGQTGQDLVSFPIYGAGASPVSIAAGEWQLQLDVAQVRVGPIYFCSTRTADTERCPTAMLEFRQSSEMDALDPSMQEMGLTHGLTSHVRSAIYDYGISWLETEPEPQSASDALNGHSAHFEGTAVRDALSTRFIADVDIVPQVQGAFAVVGTPLEHEVRTTDTSLVVRMDPNSWWQNIDFDSMCPCGPEGVVIDSSSSISHELVIRLTASNALFFEWNR